MTQKGFPQQLARWWVLPSALVISRESRMTAGDSKSMGCVAQDNASRGSDAVRAGMYEAQASWKSWNLS